MRLLKVLGFVLFFAGSLFAEPTPTELYELEFRIEREYSLRASDILEKIAGKDNYAVSVIVDLGITKKNPAQISRMSLIKSPVVPPRTKDEASNVVETMPEGMTYVEKRLFYCLEYFYQGKYDKVVSGCLEILKLEPDNITARMRLGSAYFAVGNKKEAGKTWQGAIERDPTNEEMKKLIRSL